MSPVNLTFLKDKPRRLYLAVPDVGPLAIRLNSADVSALSESLNFIKDELKVLRPGRDSHRILLDLTPSVFEQVGKSIESLLRVLDSSGFNVVGFLEGSAGENELSAKTDLLVMENAGKGSHLEFDEYERRLERERHAKLMVQWDEALAMNKEFDEQKFNEVWEEALAIDVQINAFDLQYQNSLMELRRVYRHSRNRLVKGYTAIAIKDLEVASQNHMSQLVAVNASEPKAEVPEPVLSTDNEPSSNINVVTHVSSSPSANTEEEEGEGDVLTKTVAQVKVIENVVYDRRVRSGQVINAETGSLTLLEPVNTGSKVIAAGHVTALKEIQGEIYAGYNGNREAQIHCHHFNAPLVSIGGVFASSEDFPASLTGKNVVFYLEDPKSDKPKIRYRVNHA